MFTNFVNYFRFIFLNFNYFTFIVLYLMQFIAYILYLYRSITDLERTWKEYEYADSFVNTENMNINFYLAT